MFDQTHYQSYTLRCDLNTTSEPHTVTVDRDVECGPGDYPGEEYLGSFTYILRTIPRCEMDVLISEVEIGSRLAYALGKADRLEIREDITIDKRRLLVSMDDQGLRHFVVETPPRPQSADDFSSDVLRLLAEYYITDSQYPESRQNIDS